MAKQKRKSQVKLGSPPTPQVTATELSDLDLTEPLGRRSWPGVLAWLVYLLPFVVATGMVAYYGVNVPFADQWGLPNIFAAVAARKGVISQLLECTSVHPLLFPKLLWIGLAFATKWNVRSDLFATLFMVLPILIVCVRLVTKEKGATGWPANAAIFVSSLLLFSFVHYDTFLSGYQLSFTLIDAAVMWAIYLLCTSHAHPIRGLVLAWTCCIVASFSSLQGMMSWIVILPCLPVLFSTARRRAVTACGTLFLGAVCVALYFVAFTRVDAVSDHTFWRHHPATAAGFLLAVLGAPIAPGSFITVQWTALPMGACVLVLFCVGVWRMRSRWRIAAPWLSIGLYSIGFAALTALGRSEKGVPAAVSEGSRYFCISVLLTVAAIQLSRQALPGRKSSSVLFLGLVAVIGVCAAWRSAASLATVSELKQGRERAAACLEVLNYIDPLTDNHREGCLFPSSYQSEELGHLMRRPAQLLDSLGWHKIAARVQFIDEPGTSRGWMDAGPDGGKPLAVGPDDWIYCSGKVTGSGEGRRPRIVFFAAGERRRFIYAAIVRSTSEWSGRIPAKFLPNGASALVAWAYDDRQQTFIRLMGSKPIIKLGAPEGVSQTAPAAGHPAFLGGEIALGNGDYRLTYPDGRMFGYYSYYFSNTTIYHFDLGYEIVNPAPGGAVYISDLASGHLWYTRADWFPAVWDSALKGWISYLPDSKDPARYSSNPRYFANLATGQIFTM
jgi:hypothetical protein